MKSGTAETREIIFKELTEALATIVASLPIPQTTPTITGYLSYRYIEKTTEQAIALKLVRLFSALLSCNALINLGMVLDAAAMFRLLDETGSDIMFLAGPKLYSIAPEPRHAKFLKEFFQEEFDHADPLESTQSRDRVSRRDIRAYIARTYVVPGFAVSDVVKVTETIDSIFSGYIHGAAVHIMDVFDGSNFRIPVGPRDRPKSALQSQYWQYLHRAIMSFETASLALGFDSLNSKLHELALSTFDPYGDPR